MIIIIRSSWYASKRSTVVAVGFVKLFLMEWSQVKAAAAAAALDLAAALAERMDGER